MIDITELVRRLQSLVDIRTETREAILRKDVNVAGNLPWQRYPERIDLIQGGGGASVITASDILEDLNYFGYHLPNHTDTVDTFNNRLTFNQEVTVNYYV